MGRSTWSQLSAKWNPAIRGQDIVAVGQPTGNLRCLDLAGGRLAWTMNNIGKVRGSLYVDRQHVYLTTIDDQIIQIGGGDSAAGLEIGWCFGAGSSFTRPPAAGEKERAARKERCA